MATRLVVLETLASEVTTIAERFQKKDPGAIEAKHIVKYRDR